MSTSRKNSIRRMMKSLSRVMMTTTSIALVACASAPSQNLGIPPDVFDGLHREGIRPPTGEASDFKERTKGKVAAMTALATVGAVFGGGQIPMGQRNQKPEGGYTTIEGHITVFNETESLAYADANVAMAEALRRKLVHSGVEMADQSRYHIASVEKFWGIDYEKISEKDNYRIYYNIESSLMEGKKVVRTYSCTGASEERGSYDHWMGNDKKNVKRYAAAVGDICADRAMASFGLKLSGDS